MAQRRQSLLGVGVYTVPEAARLTGVSAPRIRRWLTGYTFTSRAARHSSAPVLERQIVSASGDLVLSFRDLLEIRFVDAFRRHGVKAIVEPFLFEGLEFEELSGAPVRWWPLGRNRRVVIDPQRSFGQPIVTPESVPTSILAKAVKAEEGSIDSVARWYMVHPKAVKDAVEFENRLAAAVRDSSSITASRIMT